MIPVGARVAIGVLAPALLVGAGLPTPLGPVAAASGAMAALAASAALARGANGGRARRAAPPGAVAIVAGAWLIAARIALGGTGAADAPGALPVGAGPWEGRVVALSSPKEGQQRFTAAIRPIPTIEGPAGGTDGDVVVAVTAPRFPVVQPGDRIRLAGRPLPPPQGGYGEYLRRTGVAGTVRSPGVEVVARANDPAGLLEHVRRGAGDALARALPEPAAGLAAGILVGLRDRVDRDLAADFTATGLSHVVAISGWNIALVAGLVGALLAGRARRTRSLVILAAIVGYTVLAGASASVVRAAAMAGVALLARESGRPGTAAAALGWAVALLVLAQPATSQDVGLQLSAAATAGLIAWSAPLTALLQRHLPGLPRWILEGLGVSLAAQAATLPIILLAFGRVAPLSPVTNLAVVPLVPAAMAAGTLALAGGALAAAGAPPIVATLAGIPGALVLGLLVGIVRVAAGLPLASLALPPELAPLAALGAAAAIAAVAGRRRLRRVVEAVALRVVVSGRPPGRRSPGPRGPSPAGETSTRAGPASPAPTRRLARVAAGLLALAVGVLVVAAATRPDGRAHVVILDVGQGDAILVVGPSGGRMLVDGGPDPDRLLVALDARVPPWDRRLDLVVLTHPHEDHVGGLPLVLQRYRVGAVAGPGMPGRSPGYEALARELAGGAWGTTRLATGDSFVLDGIGFEVLWPDRERVPAEPSDDGGEVNDASVVLLGSFEGRRFLLPGDAEAEVEATLVARGVPPVDLLKAGHHGSRTSSSPGFVGATRPAIAAVSVGADNDYGHPSAKVLARLAAEGALVLRTDEVGTIDVALAASGIDVRTERPRPTGTAGAGPGVTPAPGDPAGERRRVAAGPAGPAAYDRGDARPLPSGRRRAPALARAARVAPPPRSRGGRGRRLARPPRRGSRRACGPRARGGGRAPPRRGQGDRAPRPGRDAPPR